MLGKQNSKYNTFYYATVLLLDGQSEYIALVWMSVLLWIITNALKRSTNLLHTGVNCVLTSYLNANLNDKLSVQEVFTQIIL